MFSFGSFGLQVYFLQLLQGERKPTEFGFAGSMSMSMSGEVDFAEFEAASSMSMSMDMVQLASFGGEMIFTTTTSTTKASSSKAAKPGVMSDSKSGKAGIAPSIAPSVSPQPSVSAKPSIVGKGGKIDSKSGKSLR